MLQITHSNRGTRPAEAGRVSSAPSSARIRYSTDGDMRNRVGVTFGDPEKLRPYEAALRGAGLEPVRQLPQASTLEGLDGLLLTGGTDLDPGLYGELPHPKAEAPDRKRDQLEWKLLRDALDRDIPVLGICRGLQLFNVFHGGTLIQHLSNVERHEVRSQPAQAEVHRVRVTAGSRVAGILGVDECGVNSRHHQAIGRVGDGIAVTGVAEDGVIEVIERPDRRFALCVQWHPEDRVPGSIVDLRLFQGFAQAIGG